MRTVAWLAGLCVIAAYLIGSVPLGYLLRRLRLRRDLRRADLPGALEVGAVDDWRRDVAPGVLDAAKVLAAATIAWHAVRSVAPGGAGLSRGNLSAVGFLSVQVLTAWESVALWAGLAAVVGHLAPPWLGFRPGQGVAPALAPVVAYCPFGFAAATAAFLAALAVLRSTPRALLAGLAAFVAYAWAAWGFDWPAGYGVPNGPEMALWAALLAGVVAARAIPGARPGAQ